MARPVNLNWDETRWRNAIEQDDLYLLGAQSGWTRQEVDDWRARQGLGTQVKTNEARFFANTVLAGYEPYREHVRSYDERPMSPAQWLRTPSFKRAQASMGIPLDVFNKLPEAEKNDYYVPKGGQHAIPYAAEEAAWIGRANGNVISTTGDEKFAKSKARWGQHEQVFLSGAKPVRGGLRSGPGSLQSDQYTPLKAAFLLEGEAWGSGQAAIDSSLGEVGYRTPTRIYSKDELQVADTGKEWGPGQSVSWAAGPQGKLSGHRSNWFGQRLLSVEKRKIDEGKHEGEFEYTAVFQAFRPISESSVKVGYGGTKAQADPRDLSGVRIVGQEGPAGIQWISSLKDKAGAAHSFFMEEWRTASPEQRQKMAEELGYKDASEVGSYAELGQRPLTRFANQVLEGRYFSQIDIPERIHRSRRDEFAGSIVPGSERDVEGSPDMLDVSRRFNALVGPAAVQVMQSHGAVSPRLSRQEQDVLREEMPRTMARLARAGHRTQRARQTLLQADLASQGGAIPGVSYSAKAAEGSLRALIAQAETDVRADLKLDASANVDQSRVARRFSELMSTARGTNTATGNQIYMGGYFTRWGDESKPFVMPPFRDMPYWSASGTFEDEEVSRFQLAGFRMAVAQASGDQQGVINAIEGYNETDEEGNERYVPGMRSILNEMASSKDAARMAMAIQPNNDRLMVGRVLRTSNMLADDEVWAPGMGGKTGAGRVVTAMRFPSTREGMTRSTLKAISDAEWQRRGGDPKAQGIYMTPLLALANQGDPDGDIAYLIRNEDLKVGKDGRVYDRKGNPVDTRAQIREMAADAKNQGAGDPAEYASLGDPNKVKADLVNDLQNPKSYTPAQQRAMQQTWNKKWSQVGPLYNMYTRMKHGSGDREARKAMQVLANIGYGHAQRPAWQPEFANAIRTAMYGSFGTDERSYGKFTSFDPQTHMAGRQETLLGLPGLRANVRRAVQGFLTPGADKKGVQHPGLSPEDAAALQADPEHREELAGVYRDFQANVGRLTAKGVPIEQARAAAALNAGAREEKLVPLSEWAGSALGAPIAGSVLSRSLDKARQNDVAFSLDRVGAGLSGDQLKATIDRFKRGEALTRVMRKGQSTAALAYWQKQAGVDYVPGLEDKPGDKDGPVAKHQVDVDAEVAAKDEAAIKRRESRRTKQSPVAGAAPAAADMGDAADAGDVADGTVAADTSTGAPSSAARRARASRHSTAARGAGAAPSSGGGASGGGGSGSTTAAPPDDDDGTPGRVDAGADPFGADEESPGLRTYRKGRERGYPSKVGWYQPHPMRPAELRELQDTMYGMQGYLDRMPPGTAQGITRLSGHDKKVWRNLERYAKTADRIIGNSYTADPDIAAMQSQADLMVKAVQADLTHYRRLGADEGWESPEEKRQAAIMATPHGAELQRRTSAIGAQLGPLLAASGGMARYGKLDATKIWQANVKDYGTSGEQARLLETLQRGDLDAKRGAQSRLGSDVTNVTESLKHFKDSLDGTVKSADKLQKNFDAIVEKSKSGELSREDDLVVNRMRDYGKRLIDRADMLEGTGTANDGALARQRLRGQRILRAAEGISEKQEEYAQPGRGRRSTASAFAGNMFSELSFGGLAFRTRATWGLLTNQQEEMMGEYLSSEQSIMTAAMQMGGRGGGGARNQYVTQQTSAGVARERFGRGAASVLLPMQLAFGNEGLGAAATIGGWGLGAAYGVGAVANSAAGLLGSTTLAGLSGPLAVGAGLAVGGTYLGAYMNNEANRWYQAPEDDAYSRGWRTATRRGQELGPGLIGKVGGMLSGIGYAASTALGIAPASDRLVTPGMQQESANWRPGFAAYDVAELRKFVESTSSTTSPAESAAAYAQIAQVGGLTAAQAMQRTAPKWIDMRTPATGVSPQRNIYEKLFEPYLEAGIPASQVFGTYKGGMDAAGVGYGSSGLNYLNQLTELPMEKREMMLSSISSLSALTRMRGRAPSMREVESNAADVDRLGSEIKVQTMRVTAENIAIAQGKGSDYADSLYASFKEKYAAMRPEDMQRAAYLNAGMGSIGQSFGLLRGTAGISTFEQGLSGMGAETLAGLESAGAMLSPTLRSTWSTAAIKDLAQSYVDRGMGATNAEGLGNLQQALGRFGKGVPNRSDVGDTAQWATPFGQRVLQETNNPMWMAWAGAAESGGEWQNGQSFGMFEKSRYGVYQEIGTQQRMDYQNSMRLTQASWNVTQASGQLDLHKDFMALTQSLRGLEKTTIEANRAYSLKQLDFSRASATMQYGQAMQNLAHQEKVWQLQTGWQREEFGIQAERQGQQQTWQRENFSYQESMAGLQYGWNLEDVDRNLRLASGQQRQQLIRQRDRLMISYSMEEGQRGRERERFETQADWQTTDLERQRAHFETLTQLQQDYFNMQKAHLTESYMLQMGQLDAQESHMRTIWGLEDKERDLRNAYQDKQLEFQKKELEHQLEIAKKEEEQVKKELENWEKIQTETAKWQDRVYTEFTVDGRLTKQFISMIDEWERQFKARGGGYTAPSDGTPDPEEGESIKDKNQSIAPAVVKPKVKEKDRRDITDFSFGQGAAALGLSDLLARRAASNTDSAGPIYVQVMLGDEDVTSLVAVRVTQSPKFEQGLQAMYRNASNRGY